MDVELLLWMKAEPVQLIQGSYISFDTGAMGESANFYMEVTNSTPINIFMYSTEVRIQMLTTIRTFKSTLPSH